MSLKPSYHPAITASLESWTYIKTYQTEKWAYKVKTLIAKEMGGWMLATWRQTPSATSIEDHQSLGVANRSDSFISLYSVSSRTDWSWLNIGLRLTPQWKITRVSVESVDNTTVGGRNYILGEGTGWVKIADNRLLLGENWPSFSVCRVENSDQENRV